ncbi:MAG: hypothetical protein QF582_13400 [Alphaproteobacteria bacterium]|jgi:hypothetical protein|nr:hypothetical protein [Alphaproteobacteria bacterium]
MSKKTIGLVMAFGGMAANNYVYLHDLIYRQAPVIWLGGAATVMAVVTLVVAGAGVWMIWREAK